MKIYVEVFEEVLYMAFELEEVTIDRIHLAMEEGEITSKQLVESYLSRIDKYDEKLHSIVMVNPNALKEAEELDEVLKDTNKKVGPLHGIPVVIKDQFYTKGMPTTFGSIAFQEFEAEEDATVIKKLKQAGAVILAKTALPDFATSWFGFSSVTGETKNPYDLTRDPGASSSGTAASIAANLGAVGIGSDCGGSIRVPSSFCNLFGVRVTTGMISRQGMSPLVHFQDTPGPMTRSVKDAAILLDTMTGFDPADDYTAAAIYKIGNYVDGLNKDMLNGARIGVLNEGFGTGSDSEPVNKVTKEAIKKMKSAGAETVGVSIPNLSDYLLQTSLYIMQSKKDFNDFIADKKNISVSNVDEIYENKQYHKELDLFEAIVTEGPEDPEQTDSYYKQRHAQKQFQQEIIKVIVEYRLDAIVFPDVKVLPPVQKDIPNMDYTVLTFPTNTIISSQSGVPSISMPAGFSDDGIPVGIEMIGKPYDEGKLLSLAYSYEKFANPRKAPALFSSVETKEEIR